MVDRRATRWRTEWLAIDDRSCVGCERHEWHGACYDSPNELACETRHKSLSELAVRSGYRRTTLDSTDLLKCLSRQEPLWGEQLDKECLKDFSGSLRSVCDGSHRNYNGKRRKCPGGMNSVMLAIAVFIGLAIAPPSDSWPRHRQGWPRHTTKSATRMAWIGGAN